MLDDTKDDDKLSKKEKVKTDNPHDLSSEDYTPALQAADFEKVMSAISLSTNLNDLKKIWNDYGRRIVNGLKSVGNEKYKTVSEKYLDKKAKLESGEV